jgi:hypothetical protein
MRKTIAKASAPKTANPPTTPPTIGPMFDFLLGTATDAPPAVGLAVADCALSAVLLSAVLLSAVVLPSTLESTVDEGSSEELVKEETAASDGRELVVVPSENVRCTEMVKPEDAQPCSVMTVRSE